MHMTSASSMSVSVECVNICKLWKGGDVSGKYDCSALSCAWKAPRTLTGFLASTHSASSPPNHRSIHNTRKNCFTCSELENLSFMYTNAQDHAKIKRRVSEVYKEHERELTEKHAGVLLDLLLDLRYLSKSHEREFLMYTLLRTEGQVSVSNKGSQIVLGIFMSMQG